MAICGVDQHTKAHTGLHTPSSSQVPVRHLRVHALLISPALGSTQLPPPPTHTPANPAVSAVLTSLSVFISRSPHFSLPLSISALLPLLSWSGPVCWSCSDYFSPSPLLWAPPNAYSLSHNPNKNYSLSHTMELSQHQFIQHPHRRRVWPGHGTSPGSIPQSLLRSPHASSQDLCEHPAHPGEDLSLAMESITNKPDFFPWDGQKMITT